MAESPTIVFEPDMSRVRRAVDDVVASAARNPVQLPVTPQTGGMPTVGGGSGLTAGAALGGVFSGGYVGGPLATPNFFQQNPSGQIVPPGGPPGGGGPPPGGGGASRNPWWGRDMRYMAVAVGSALGHVGAGLAQATRQYSIDSSLAGNDLREQLNATLDYRRSVASAGGFVGQAVAFLQDPTGEAEANVRATIATSEARDRQTTGRRSVGEMRRGLANDLLIATQTAPFARAVAQVAADTDDRTASLRLAKAESSKRDEDVLNSQIAERRSTFAKRVQKVIGDAGYDYVPGGDGGGSFVPRVLRDEAERMVRKADDDFFSSQRSGMKQTATGFDRDIDTAQKVGEARRGILYRDESFRLVGVRSALLADANTSRALAAGNAEQARIEGIAGQGREEVRKALESGRGWHEIGAIVATNTLKIAAERRVAARERAFDLADAEAEIGVAELQLQHRPLEARMQAVRDRAAAANRRLPNTPEGDAQRTANVAAAEAEIAVIGQRDDQLKAYRRQELTGEREALGLELKNAVGAAASVRSRTAAQIEARQLRDDGDDDTARQVLENAVVSQQVRKKRVLEAVQATEVDINSVAIDGPRPGEDTRDLLKAINDSIQALRTDMNTGSGGSKTTE